MPRFGIPRANTGDSSNLSSDFQYASERSEGGTSSDVSGFAPSVVAAGGVTTTPSSTMKGQSVIATGQGQGVGGGNNNDRTTVVGPSGTTGGVDGGNNNNSSSRRGGGNGGERSRRYGKQKGSITSGISTLFRRQPSPDFDESQFLGGMMAGTTTNNRDPTGAYAGSIARPASATNVGSDASSAAWTSVGDNTTVTSSGQSSRMMGIPKRMKSPSNRGRSKGGSTPSRSRPNSRSNSRSNTPIGRSGNNGNDQQQQQQQPTQHVQFKQSKQKTKRQAQNQALREQQRQAQIQAAQQQYSQAQRDLLHKGAYDAPQYVQQHTEPTQSQREPTPEQQQSSVPPIAVIAASGRASGLSPNNAAGTSSSPRSIDPGISQSASEGMSTAGASDALSGATSLSAEFGEGNRADDRRDRRGGAMSYDDTVDTNDYTETSRTLSEGEYSEGEYSEGESTYDESTVEDRDRRRGRGQRDRDRGRGGGGNRTRTRSPKGPIRLPRRYRGFSTSISSLFLDESIVCGALGCCGLLLSARTEHLLNERNVKRGLTRRGAGGAAGRGKEGARRAPSRILGIAWVVSIMGVLATYAIWGFDDQENAGGYEEGYDWYYDGENDDYNGNDDDGQNQEYEEEQGNDDANQANDDYNQAADDGVQNDDANNFYAYDDAVAVDDGNNVDDAVQADDGNAQAGDDAIQADDGVNGDDAIAADDAAQYYQDDFNANRKLKNQRNTVFNTKQSTELRLAASKATPSPKHNFNGIMKLRDHKEYIFDPAVEFTSRAYTDLMNQFKDDEYTPSFRQRLLDGDEYEVQYDDQYEGEQDVENTSFEQGQQVRTVIVLLFLFLLGVIGRRRRMRTRFAILRSRAQDDHLYYAAILTKGGGTSASLATPDNTVMENFHEREDKYDGACSHTLFGCYPVDTQLANYADDDDEGTLDDTVLSGSTAGNSVTIKKRRGGDFMSRTMTTIFNCCCGKMCQCWCQLFSVCALAQEARETRLLLPPSMQRIDIITHQPFHEYAKDVNNVRRRFMEKANRTWVQHYAALSHLSRYILLGFVLIVAFVVMIMFLHPIGGFGWGDALVLIATFTQSFLVLVIVFGIFHRSDLSFDAVVKFFAVGFTICVPVGFMLEAIIMNGLFMMYYVTFYVLHWIGSDDFDDWYEDYYAYIHIAGELVNAFFIAALVEELCKYYGFRFLEHPDLIFITGLDRSAAQTRDTGGLDSYKYDSQLVSNFSQDSGGGDCESETDSRGRKRKSKRRRSILREEEDEDEPDLRSLQQQAAAITTGMICVAVGLACAENFLYVFFLGGAGGDEGSVGQEMAVLIFRSIFPVHALSAAMQSINMVRKFIEERHGVEGNIGVGRIIFPAILLHGTFDAILLVVNGYIESAWERYEYENGGVDDDEVEAPYNVLAVNLIAPFGIVGVMAISFGWYTYQNKLQMLRLAKYDILKDRMRSGIDGFNAPNLV